MLFQVQRRNSDAQKLHHFCATAQQRRREAAPFLTFATARARQAALIWVQRRNSVGPKLHLFKNTSNSNGARLYLFRIFTRPSCPNLYATVQQRRPKGAHPHGLAVLICMQRRNSDGAKLHFFKNTI